MAVQGSRHDAAVQTKLATARVDCLGHGEKREHSDPSGIEHGSSVANTITNTKISYK